MSIILKGRCSIGELEKRLQCKLESCSKINAAVLQEFQHLPEPLFVRRIKSLDLGNFFTAAKFTSH